MPVYPGASRRLLTRRIAEVSVPMRVSAQARRLRSRDRGSGALQPPRQLRAGVSLLLAEGRQPVWIAQQAGHSLAVLLSTYAHLIEEYAERERVDPELEIAKVREINVRLECVSATEERSAGLTAHEKSPASAGPFWDGSDGGQSRTLPPDDCDIEVWAEPPRVAGH